jgi:tRNA (cytidine/uridine-2'-O-)-methyltransferase
VFHVILHRPEIPPNTGNVIRLCANTGCVLHLVRPLGFDLSEKSVQRAGMDYAEVAEVRVHDSLDDCLGTLAAARVFAIETGSPTNYAQVRYQPGDALLFGSESKGLPAQVLAGIGPERTLSIPMRPGNRSLNLNNSVALVVYEAWRQQHFALTP